MHVGHEDLFLDHDLSYLIPPYRQPHLETNLGEILATVDVEVVDVMLLAADARDCPVTELQFLGEVIEHHEAAERRGQCGDQQAVIAARAHAREGAGGKTTETDGDQPLQLQQAQRHAAGRGPPAQSTYHHLPDTPT